MLHCEAIKHLRGSLAHIYCLLEKYPEDEALLLSIEQLEDRLAMHKQALEDM